jgi:hypothetical protein
MRYRLRTLLILLALGPPLLAGAWYCWQTYREANRVIPDIEELQELIQEDVSTQAANQ